jgi:hypothetical protein
LPDERLDQTKVRIENSMHRTFARTVIDPRSEKLLPINFRLEDGESDFHPTAGFLTIRCRSR